MATANELAKLHVQMCIQCAKCEVSGDIKIAERLRALGNLRLCTMTNDELWELAKLLSNPPMRPVSTVHAELTTAIDEKRETAREWIPKIFRNPADDLSKN